MDVMRRGLLLSCAVCFTFAGAVKAQETQAESYNLAPKVIQKWTYVLPTETWSPVSGSIPIAHAGGPGFSTEVQGTALAVDTNGDGKVDDKVKGIKDLKILKSKDANGNAFAYAVRLSKTGDAWTFASGTVLSGKVKGENVTLIDQDNNGSYVDVGVDAMIVGEGDAAGLLSRVANLGGTLYELEFQANGRSVAVKPFTGEVGTLDLRSDFESKGRLEAAIVVNAKGDLSFNVATAKTGMKVPTGDYTLKSGYVTLGTENVRVREGRARTVAVRKDELTKLEWGGPVAIEFDHAIAGGEVKIPYTSLKYFGRGGEEYYSFFPDATSPIVKVTDKANGRLLSQGRFGGC